MKAIASLNVYAFMLDWLNDVLDGRIGPGHQRRVLIPKAGVGVYTRSGEY